MRSLIIGLALLASPAAAEGFRDRAALERLAGTYASPAPEPWYGAFGTRAFTFRDGHWTLDFTLALDAAMQRPVFRFRTGGPYAIGAPAMVPGAFEAVFFEDSKHVTLLTGDAVTAAAFGLAGCNLTAGAEADISITGCARWKPVAECREDHDLLAQDSAGRLYFGVRPRDNDMCSAARRPTALLPPVLPRE
jgi:predicted small secreted protein